MQTESLRFHIQFRVLIKSRPEKVFRFNEFGNFGNMLGIEFQLIAFICLINSFIPSKHAYYTPHDLAILASYGLVFRTNESELIRFGW